MIFTTLKFLVFFVAVFFVYYMVPKKLQWLVLLAASIYFYLCASVKYAIFVLMASLITYLGALILDKLETKQSTYLKEHKETLSKEDKKSYKTKIEKKKKIVITLTILATLSMLLVMKYTGFVLENISAIANVFHLNFTSPAWNFILPLGISFYTFMSIGYAIDVYRGEYPAEKNFLKYFLFVSYFPHILQGPMDKYNDLAEDLFAGKKFDYTQAVQGIYRIVIGVLKKMLVADKLAPVVGTVITNLDQYFGINIFLAILFYAIQLYADFSGYMDIAIGCSKMLGIRIAENFDAPYFSKSIAEYWRRWHISLGAWFRDYVYYPILRGNLAQNLRKHFKDKNKYLSNNLPTVFALAVLWILIGFWHGSTWAFILYGIYHGGIIILSTLLAPVYDKFYEKFPRLVKTKIYGAFQIIRTFCLVLGGYFLFCVGDLKPAMQMFSNMFKNNFDGVKILANMTQDSIVSVSIGTIILIILDILTIKKVDIYEKFRKVPFFLRWPIYCVRYVCSHYASIRHRARIFIFPILKHRGRPRVCPKKEIV